MLLSQSSYPCILFQELGEDHIFLMSEVFAWKFEDGVSVNKIKDIIIEVNGKEG